jgi:hypothetical protein
MIDKIKNTKILENGQKMIEIEPNIWVDYDTYFTEQIRTEIVNPTPKK